MSNHFCRRTSFFFEIGLRSIHQTEFGPEGLAVETYVGLKGIREKAVCGGKNQSIALGEHLTSNPLHAEFHWCEGLSLQYNTMICIYLYIYIYT